MIGKSIGKIIGKDIVRYVGKVRLGSVASAIATFAKYFSADTETDGAIYEDTATGRVVRDQTDADRNLIPQNTHCILGDGTALLRFTNLGDITYDSITVIENGVETVKTLSTADLALDSAKSYILVRFKNAGTVVSEFFLGQYKSIPSTSPFFQCRYNTGVLCELINPVAGNFATFDGSISPFAEFGYSRALAGDGTAYFDTSILANTVTELEVIWYHQIPSVTEYLCGAWSGDRFYIQVATNNIPYLFVGANSRVLSSILEQGAKCHLIWKSDGTITFNNTSLTPLAGSLPTSLFYIFNRAAAGSSTSNLVYLRLNTTEFRPTIDGKFNNGTTDLEILGGGTPEISFIPADPVLTTKDISGLDLQVSAINKNAEVNEYAAPAGDSEFAAKGFILTGTDPDQPIYTTGTPNDLNLENVTGVADNLGTVEGGVITLFSAAPTPYSMVSFPAVIFSQTGDIANNNVQYQTGELALAALPETVVVTLENSIIKNVPVTWADTDSYDASTAGSYTFTATWGTLPAGVDDDDNLTPPTTELVVAQGILTEIDVSDQNWTESQVDDYLVAAALLGYSGVTIYIGGNNAAPSATGETAIATLIADGNHVYTS